jgi:hypothetical protein
MPPSNDGLFCITYKLATFSNGISLLVFININAERGQKDDDGREEVLQCLKFFVVSIQSTHLCNIKISASLVARTFSPWLQTVHDAEQF